MSKELEALQRIKDDLEYVTRLDYVSPIVRGEVRDELYKIYHRELPDLDIIETALENYVELTNKPVMLYGRTNGRNKAIIDMISKNFKEVKITNLVDETKVKAFDIIKKYKVNVSVIIYCIENDICYTEYVRKELWDDAQENEPAYPMEESEFNILKEALL